MYIYVYLFVKAYTIYEAFFLIENVSSGNVCYLAHFFIGSKQILSNLYIETFLFHFELSVIGLM